MDGHHVVFKLARRRESERALVAECGVDAAGVAALIPVLVAVGEGFVLGQGLYAGELVVAEAAGVLDADAWVVPVHDVHVVVETVQVGVGGVAVVAGVNLAGFDGVNTLHVQLQNLQGVKAVTQTVWAHQSLWRLRQP